jgi:hypothetical protein
MGNPCVKRGASIESLNEHAHGIRHLPFVGVTVGLESGLLVVPLQISQEPERRASKSSEAGHPSSDRSRPPEPLRWMRNARLNREEAFSYAMIIVSSAIVSSS